MKKTTIAVVCALGAMSSQTLAGTIVADARSNAMGNTGVVSSDYLLAPFHNPALGALHREDDDVGILLPALGVNVSDKDETVSTIDDAQSLYDRFENGSNTIVDEAELTKLLDDLEGDKPISVTGGANFAVAIPTRVVSVNLFAGGHTDVIASTEIVSSAGRTVEQRYNESAFEMIAFGVTEVGLSFAKSFEFGNHDIAFGISPKYQNLVTYSQRDSIDSFDLDNYDKSEVTESAFNLDLGMAWHSGPLRAGLALKNLFSQEINTQVGNYTYELNPQATVGFGYAGEFVAASVDFDLTKQKRFQQLADDTQFLRFGIEGNAWGWAQLRAGYEIDLEDTLENSITAGIGISPFDVVSLDLAGSYAGDNQFGASLNLAFTF